MTEGEKMVWAATFAMELARQEQSKREYGAGVDVPGCVETAWDAVEEMRDCRPDVEQGWGATSDVLAMLDEMLS